MHNVVTNRNESLRRVAGLRARGFFLSVAAFLAMPALLHARRGTNYCDDIHGEAIYECLGMTERGKKLLLKELVETSRKDESEFHELPALVARLNYVDAIPALRNILANAPSVPIKYDDRARIRRVDLYVAAQALGDFGDTNSARIIRDYLTLLDSTNDRGSSWEDALKALAKLGGPEAEAYGRLVINGIQMVPAGDRSAIAIHIAEFARDSRATALTPDLRKIKTSEMESFMEAMIHGFRMELGDRDVRKYFRDPLLPQIEAHERGESTGITFHIVHPECYLAGLGDPEDLKLFIFFEAPGQEETTSTRSAIIRLLDHHESYPGSDYAQFKQKLLEGIKHNTMMYESRDSNFSWGGLAAHRYLLTRLGDASSAESLRKIAIAQKDPSEPSAWNSIRYGMELGLSGMADALDVLLRGELAGNGDGHIWERREETMETAARKLGTTDARWTLFLFDSNVRDQALFQFTRVRPASACKIITDFAATSDTNDGTVSGDALLALTAPGMDCAPDLVRLARNNAAAPVARGIAIEILTMLQASEAPALRKLTPVDDLMHARIQSAENIAKFIANN